MSDDATASVRIVADASGVEPGIDEAKEAISGLGGFLSQLKNTWASVSQAMKEGFAEGVESAHAAKDGIHEVGQQAEKEKMSVRELALSIKEIGASAKESALGMHEGVERINEWKKGLQEVFEVYMAFLGVEMFGELAEHMGEAAEQTEHLAQRFGITTQQMQGLHGVALGTGVSIDSLTKGMTMLERTASTTPEVFTKLGIEVRKGESGMDLLIATAERFKGLENGPAKTAAAMELMKRSGAEMLPVLNQGADGLQELITKAKQYGEVNEEATKSGVTLAESVNEGKMAWDGLKQTLTQAFAPLLTEIIDGFNGLVKAMTASYESGGAVKVVFEAIVEVIEGFGEIFKSVGDAVSEIYTAMGFKAGDWGSTLKTVINTVVTEVKLFIALCVGMVVEVGAAFDEIRGYLTTFDARLRQMVSSAALAIEELETDFSTLGRVIYDALTLNWSKITADWNAGMAQVAKQAAEGAAKIKAAFAGEQAEAAGYHKQGADAQSGYEKWQAGFMRPHAKPGKTGVEGGDGGDGDDVPDLAKHKKPPKGPSLVEQYQAQLQEELLDEQNWGVDVAEFTAKFWADKLATTTKGSKDWLEIHKQYATAQLAAFKKTQADEISAIKANLAVQSDLAKDDADIAKINAQEKLEAIDEAEKRGEISAVRAAQMKAAVNQQMLRDERDYQTKIYQLQVAAIQQEIALNHLPEEQKRQEYQRLLDLKKEFDSKIGVLEKQAGQQQIKDANTTADAMRQKWQSILSPIVSAWGSAMQGIIAKTMTLRQAWQSIGQAILQEGIQVVEKTVMKWIIGEATKTAATTAGAAERTAAEEAAGVTTTGLSAIAALKQIAHSAAVAAARVYASIAQIPVVGPVLAPVAAAAALVAVVKLGQAIFSAEGGWDRVPYDGAQTILHKDEMVLSKPYADVIRGMAASVNSQGPIIPSVPRSPLAAISNAANVNAPAPANTNPAAGLTLNYVDGTGQMSDAQLMAKRGVLAKALVKAHAEGHFAGSRLQILRP